MLVEDTRANVLIDPGNFSFKDPSVVVEALPNIDYILITHKHPDHCFPEFISAVLETSPDARVVGNEQVSSVLEKVGITVETSPPDGIEMTTLQHAKLWQDMPQPQNSVFTLWGELTHFGDNRELENVETADTAAFPIVAPWGSLVDAIDRLIAHPPKRVIPIHDWHLSEAGQAWYYQRAKDAFEGHAIELLSVGPTESIDFSAVTPHQPAS